MGKRGACGQLVRVVHMSLLIHRDAGVTVNIDLARKISNDGNFRRDFDEIKLLFI